MIFSEDTIVEEHAIVFSHSSPLTLSLPILPQPKTTAREAITIIGGKIIVNRNSNIYSPFGCICPRTYLILNKNNFIKRNSEGIRSNSPVIKAIIKATAMD